METRKNLYSKNLTHILLRFTIVSVMCMTLALMISVKLFKNTVLEADEWRNRSDFNRVEKHEVGNNIYNHTSLTD
jgi:hypothetical protein